MTDTGNIRELVLDSLIEILEKGSYSHVILSQALGKYQYLSKQDRGFVTRVTEGVLEYQIQIDWMLNHYSSIKVKKMKPVIRTILRMSVYQIVYMDRIPDSAACNEGVKLAIKRKFVGLKGFVNGTLRRISREKENLLKELSDPAFPWPWIRYSVPEWLYDMWKEELGQEQTDRVLSAFLREAPTTVRCNLSLASKSEILDSLSAQVAQVSQSPYSEKVLLLSGYDHLEGLEAFLKGWIQVQDLSSVFAGEAARPKKGSYILDVCAAPGGKSLHMADMLAGTGMVEARDISQAKAALIEENRDRAGFSNVCVNVWNALEPDPGSIEKADILLADLPCSGLGIIGKKPDIKLHMCPEKLETLRKLQREILSVVWQYVKPGGILVYSTCTIHKGENQENTEWFLKNFPFEPVDLTGQLGDRIQELSQKEGQIQFLPGTYPCDGFYMAVLKRKI